jgi:hypothetical protein
MDTLLHWLLLNTEARADVEATLDCRVFHSTRTEKLSEADKVSRQLCAMNAMDRAGYTPKMRIWCTPGTLMAATRRMEVVDYSGEVIHQISS